MSDIREALEKAFDGQDEAEDNDALEASPSDYDSEPPLEEANEEAPEPTEPTGEEASAPESADEKQPEVNPEKEPPSDSFKAPASWTPKARETWAKLPKEAQAEISKREKQITDTLAQTSQQRQFVKQINDVLSPYREGLVAAGVQSPLEAIDTLFRTEASLRVGTQQTKAATIASMIKQYGVDIQTLDNMLVGQPTQSSPNSELEQMLEQRLAPFNQYLAQQQQYQQYQQQQESQSAHTQVSEFSKNAEFLEDVRLDMADLIDLAAKRGQNMSLEDAYKRACAVHPEISKIMDERQRQQGLMDTQQKTQRKRHASVSVTGRQGGQGSRGEPESLRSAIEQAWDEQMGG